MTTKSQQGALRVRARLPWHIVVPGSIVLAVGSLLIANSWHALRPAIDVQVVPAVFTNAGSAIIPVQGQHAETSPPRNGVTVQAPGWLEADPYLTACTALADGVVQTIEVLEGQPVEQGQIVARLVPDDAALALRRAEADVATAQAEVRLAEVDRAAAQDDWDHPIERERAVAAAKATAAETQATLAQLPALVDAEQAKLAGQKEELTRAESALQSGAATDIEVIILRKAVDAQAASLQALRDRKAIIRAQLDRERAEVVASQRNFELRIAERRAVDAADAGLARSNAKLLQQQAALDEAKLRMQRMIIRSPMTGLVQRRLKMPGDKVMLGMDDRHSSHIVHVYDPAMLQVRVDVPLADAANIFVGQRCEIVVDVLPDTTFTGKVTRITNEADLQKNTLQIKVRVIDPSPHLRPEMLTRVKFLPGNNAGTSSINLRGAPTSSADHVDVLVPQAGITERENTSRIWVVRERRGEHGAAYPVDVQVASIDDGVARVTGAIHTGDLVIITPSNLKPGARVRMHLVGGSAS